MISASSAPQQRHRLRLQRRRRAAARGGTWWVYEPTPSGCGRTSSTLSSRSQHLLDAAATARSSARPGRARRRARSARTARTRPSAPGPGTARSAASRAAARRPAGVPVNSTSVRGSPSTRTCCGVRSKALHRTARSSRSQWAAALIRRVPRGRPGAARRRRRGAAPAARARVTAGESACSFFSGAPCHSCTMVARRARTG